MVIIAIGPLLWRAQALDRIGQFGPVRFLARISYQVYLTHWPIVVFWKYYTFADIHALAALALGIASLISGWALFELNERISGWLRRSKAAIALGAGLFLTLTALQGAVIWSQGFPARIPDARAVFDPSAARAQESALCGQTHLAADGREFGDRAEDPLITCENIRAGADRLYLLGDSHARHLVPGFSAAYPDRSIAAMYFTSCLVQSGIENYRYDYEGRTALAQACEARNLALLSYFETLAPAQIVIHQYSSYTGDQTAQWYDAAQSLLDTLSAFGHEVVWIGSVPYPDILLADCFVTPLTFSAAALARRCLGDTQTAARILQNEIQRQSIFGSAYLSATPFFCPSLDTVSCRYLMEGQPLYRDAEHLNVQGSERLVN